MTLIAGEAEVAAVMVELIGSRAVFHSEADFQHAFAWTLHSMRPSIQVRLEVRQAGGEHVDLLCIGPQGRTAIEFKYFTARWDGTDPATGEQVSAAGTRRRRPGPTQLHLRRGAAGTTLRR